MCNSFTTDLILKKNYNIVMWNAFFSEKYEMHICVGYVHIAYVNMKT